MSKKDYIKIADILAKLKKESAPNNEGIPTVYFANVVSDFITMLKKDNPNFDDNRFVAYITQNS